MSTRGHTPRLGRALAVAAVAGGVLLGTGAAAGAQEYPPTPSTSPDGGQATTSSTPTGLAGDSGGGQLPQTGSDGIDGTLMVALAAVGAGAAMTVVGVRRRGESS